MNALAIATALGFAAFCPARAAAAPQSYSTQSSAKPAAVPHSSAAAQSTPTSANPRTADTQAAGTPAISKHDESYALGMNIARRLKDQPIDLDDDALVQGFKDELAGGKTQLTEDQMTAALKQLSSEAQASAQKKEQEAAEANMKEGESFLAANKTKAGVVTLPSGLQYKIEKQGTGPKPTASDTVVCNYRGTFINGTEFDSSYKRGQPATFPVGRVIKGWTEALQLMPVGSKWELFIPSDLAYGPRGAGGVIGPNATLIFEVELLSIKGQ